MEGVTDYPMRTLLTELGGFQCCVSEFIRVNQDTVPEKVFYRMIPELRTQGKTASGCPVIVQILGGDPDRMAESAATAVRLGALGIDINFGCPAPTVNRHDGGAVLLKSPQRIYDIVKAVRERVSPDISVSAKMRLGWENIHEIFKNAESATLAGANWLTIHARTRAQGYAPPVHWEILGEVQKSVPLPIVANGDIRTLEDFKECRKLSQCEHFMIGRGALAEPSLAQLVLRELKGSSTSEDTILPFKNSKERWRPLFKRFIQVAEPQALSPLYTTKRIKQWLNLAERCHSISWSEPIKRAKNLDEIWSCF